MWHDLYSVQKESMSNSLHISGWSLWLKVTFIHSIWKYRQWFFQRISVNPIFLKKILLFVQFVYLEPPSWRTYYFLDPYWSKYIMVVIFGLALSIWHHSWVAPNSSCLKNCWFWRVVRNSCFFHLPHKISQLIFVT